MLELTNDLTDPTEIHLLKKKSQAFFWLKEYTAKPNAQSKALQRFRKNNMNELTLEASKKWMEIDSIQ